MNNSEGLQRTIYIDIPAGTIDYINVSNNIFENMSNAYGFVFDSTLNSQPCNTSLQALNNTFISNGNHPQGYGALIDVSASTNLCLEFIGNHALSSSSPSNPSSYSFSVIPPGTFNRTFESDSSTNSGQFEIGVGVGAPGTCSQ